jgi:sec-independent protein translocase protein TatC
MAAGYYFAPQIQELLLYPFQEEMGPRLALLAPAEGFIVRLKISFVAGLFASAPWIFYQLWKFVAPGLFDSEKKMVLPVVFFSSVLFLTGAVFAAYVIPMATQFFLSFTTEDVANYWSLGRFIDFELRLFVAFGVVFELPLLIYFLARFGIVTPTFLRTYRRHMYVVFLVGASLITPPDVFTQVFLAVPLVVLYEVSIFLAVIARKRWEAGALTAEDVGRGALSGAGKVEDGEPSGDSESAEAASPYGRDG